LGDSEPLKVGQFVLAVANAFVGQPSVTAGVITSSRRSIRAWGGQTFDNVVVSDAQVNPGYSGGPLVDASGKMIALNTAYAFNRALSIPVNTVKEVAENLKADGRVKHAFLGVTLDEVYLPEGVPELESQDSGLMILSVSNGSPAKSAGLALGDVVVGFNGKAVSSYGDLRKLLSANMIGKKTTLSVLRGGKLNEFNLTPADDQAA
jgi:serine protease Do